MRLLQMTVRGSGPLAQHQTESEQRYTLKLCPDGDRTVELEELCVDFSFDFYKADALLSLIHI